jgi:filamentous hemagglutinin
LYKSGRARLQKIFDGNEFNRIRSSSYPNNEVYLINPKDPNRYVRLDSYKPGLEIVSRKYTQFSEIEEATGIKYIQELKDKYPSGEAIIANVDSNKTIGEVKGNNYQLESLINTQIDGEMILEIPVQIKPIPPSVINEARKWGIKIRDVQGNVY